MYQPPGYSEMHLYKTLVCNETETRIVNGFESQLGDFPYQVSLQMNNHMFCGGTILDHYHILTAAHCVAEFGDRMLSVVIGSYDLKSQPGIRHRVSAVKIHEGYKSGNGWPHDIALLRLASPIKFNELVAPAVLPKPGEQLKPGQSGVVTGYGQLNKNGYQSTKLYKTQVFVESNAECQRYYHQDRIKPTNLCTRHPARITGFCRGDSGGPLTVNGKVVGIVSFSLDYGCAGELITPQVYTRVSHYIDWINYHRNF
ncbi:chymotrypsin-1-like [Phymastichus coffea]|uniref:chymotrypsin-1-like n=1 Tax=Phymastichus coffea TaxID=108790 RepID=UPI00273C1313|nr:chymotrypsin-1-like [Phymastichus coffea]